MRKMLLLFLLFQCYVMNAQKGYSIYYRTEVRHLPTVAIDVQPDPIVVGVVTDRLIFTDSLSFCYRLIEGMDKVQKGHVFGNKLRHHARTFDKSRKIFYDHVSHNGIKALVIDTMTVINWSYPNHTKIIAGFTCKPALHIAKNEDTLLVWYTQEIDLPFGPYWFVGLPGVVLEVIDQSRGWHLKAVSVEEGKYTVMIPPKVTIMSRKEFYAKRKW